ncbi:MAG TPA: NYN domain-containing protein [Kiritimatiellia bacterium]|nr:NYN domain-containing protein [Kiritimatiellia bacterium]HMO97523.1 NYN domain-containing protein [Kiritimatiellia bacterium]
MRVRRIAVLIDGAFFLKRLPKLVPPEQHESAAAVAKSARMLCKRHVQKLTGEPFSSPRSRWLDQVYRLFYYDARPFDEVAHHPILNQQIQFAKTPEALFRDELFRELRRARKFALRLGHVVKEDGWHIKDTQVTKKLLRTKNFMHVFDSAIAQAESGATVQPITKEEAIQLKNIAAAWRGLTPQDVRLGLRQKGVDMRIGLDISTLTLKKQVDTIVLVTGDSDFVPAAKLARREGVEFLLDPMWQSVKDDLHEHVDGIVSGFRSPADAEPDDQDDFANTPPSDPLEE